MMSEENKNKLNEPSASYGESLSFEKVWAMFQRIGELIQEDQKKIMKYWEKSEREWAEIRKKAEEDRERAIKDRERAEKDREKSDREWAEKFREQEERAWERSEREWAEIRKKAKEDRERAEKFREQEERARERSEREWAEVREEHKETKRVLKEVSQIVGGQGASAGEVSEDFFRGALEGKKNLAGVDYGQVLSLAGGDDQLRGQYDIVLTGPDTVVVIEVKYKLRLNDVIRFHEVQMPKFFKLFPEYARGKKVMGALAAMTLTRDAKKKAMELNYMLLTQSGQEIRVLHPTHPKKMTE